MTDYYKYYKYKTKYLKTLYGNNFIILFKEKSAHVPDENVIVTQNIYNYKLELRSSTTIFGGLIEDQPYYGAVA